MKKKQNHMWIRHTCKYEMKHDQICMQESYLLHDLWLQWGGAVTNPPTPKSVSPRRPPTRYAATFEYRKVLKGSKRVEFRKQKWSFKNSIKFIKCENVNEYYEFHKRLQKKKNNNNNNNIDIYIGPVSLKTGLHLHGWFWRSRGQTL